MNVLYLGEYKQNIYYFLSSKGDYVSHTDNIINVDDVKDIDFIISYNYGYKISNDIVKMFNGRAINMHISYLPWNRGTYPNLWSFIDNTPKGVTIHEISEEIDRGNILVQREVFFNYKDTFRTSHKKLCSNIEQLLIDYWDDIRNRLIEAKPQVNFGSYHKDSDRVPYLKYLKKGYDTLTSKLRGLNET